MADYTLSTQRMPSGGGAGGLQNDFLQANGGAGAIRAASINPNAGNIRYTPTNIPKPVENMVSKGVQHFMGATAQAAFDYQEREAQFLANEANLQFQIKAREMYSGYNDEDGNFVPGLAQATGMSAVSAYGDYTKALDKLAADTIGSMEKRVAQKALIQLHTSKNQALSKGATHRAAEFQVAQQDQLLREGEEIVTQLAADPSLLDIDPATGTLPRDPATGVNIREKYVRKFGSYAKGMEAWRDLIVASGEKIYLDNAFNGTGASKAADFYNRSGAREMTGSLKHELSFKKSLKRWADSDLSNALAARELQFKLDKRQVEVTQTVNANEMSSLENTPQEWSAEYTRELIGAGDLKRSVGESYIKRRFGTSQKAPDTENIVAWERSYSQSQLNAEGRVIGPNPLNNWAVEDITDVVFSDSNVAEHAPTMKKLTAMRDRVGTVQHKELAPIYKRLEDLIVGTDMVSQINYATNASIKAKVDQRLKTAFTKMEILSGSGQLDGKALMDIVERDYAPPTVAVTPSEAGGFIGNITPPTNMQDMPRAKQEVKQTHQAFIDRYGDDVPDPEWEYNKKSLATYYKSFQAQEAETNGQ